MTKHRPLTALQLEAARHLARGRTGAETAAAVGIRPETVSRWRQLPAFALELRRLVEVAEVGDPAARVEALIRPALDTLQAVLTDPHAARPAKIAAASALLSFAAATNPTKATS